MTQKVMMTSTRYLYGTVSMRAQRPTSGRLRTSSMILPVTIEAMTPQNMSGCSVINSGPGRMPWIIIATKMSA